MNQKIIQKMMGLLFICAVPIIIVYTATCAYAFDRNYFEKEFVKYNRIEHLGVTWEDLLFANDETLQYIEGTVNDLDFEITVQGEMREFYSEEDKLHMIDVKNIFLSFKKLRNVSILFVILYFIYLKIKDKNYKTSIAKNIIVSSIVTVCFCGILIGLMNIDFYKYFTIFHEIFFSNDLWLMDPVRDTLVNIYPEEFFIDIAFDIATLCIGLFVGITALSGLYLRRKKHEKID